MSRIDFGCRRSGSPYCVSNPLRFVDPRKIPIGEAIHIIPNDVREWEVSHKLICRLFHASIKAFYGFIDLLPAIVWNTRQFESTYAFERCTFVFLDPPSQKSNWISGAASYDRLIMPDTVYLSSNALRWTDSSGDGRQSLSRNLNGIACFLEDSSAYITQRLLDTERLLEQATRPEHGVVCTTVEN